MAYRWVFFKLLYFIFLLKVLTSFQIVVPVLPGKAFKKQLPSFMRSDDGIFEDDFIEERRKGLEQFINK